MYRKKKWSDIELKKMTHNKTLISRLLVYKIKYAQLSASDSFFFSPFFFFKKNGSGFAST